MFCLERLNRLIGPGHAGISIVVSRKVKENVEGTIWEKKLRELERSRITDVSLHSVLNDHGAFEFIP
jgi:hypothetical protein